MKVQHKCDPFRAWEVIEESPNHYIVSDGSPRGEGLAYCLPKADYEPVQEWVDVSIADVRKDTSGYTDLNGSCNSYFFVDKAGNFLNDSHQPVVVDGRVILRRRKR